jgi:hypothetical protein
MAKVHGFVVIGSPGVMAEGTIMDELMCEAAPGGANVRFPFDRERLAAFRDTFPNARWQKDSGAWFVPDPGAADRVDVWITERRRQEREADEAAERVAKSSGIE